MPCTAWRHLSPRLRFRLDRHRMPSTPAERSSPDRTHRRASRRRNRGPQSRSHTRRTRWLRRSKSGRGSDLGAVPRQQALQVGLDSIRIALRSRVCQEKFILDIRLRPAAAWSWYDGRAMAKEGGNICQAAKPTAGAFLARPCSDSSPADVNRGMAGPTEAVAARRAGLRPAPKEKVGAEYGLLEPA